MAGGDSPTHRPGPREWLLVIATEGQRKCRQEAFVSEGKVKIACMDLSSALMLKLRGYRPYMILATYTDRKSLSTIQERRKTYRKSTRERMSLETPMERSTLQVMLSGRIIITGIINEIILGLPDEKNQSEFMMESECSLMMDSDARANKDFLKGYDILALLNSSTSSLDEVMKQTHEKSSMEERSLYSLFKESQGTEYASDVNGQNLSYQERNVKRPSRQKPVDKHSKQSSISHSHRLIIPDSSKSSNSKSVTFTSQDGQVEQDVTGLMVEPPVPDSNNKEVEKQIRSISTRIPWQTAQWRGSQVAMDESNLWIAFLTEAGYLQASDINTQLCSNG
ncbi:unnamed protein product [Spodoptera exigua]|nr:unnamed protein product [Spodoptera exigua]